MIGYVAKDKSGHIHVYDEKPEYDEKIGMWFGGDYLFINDRNITKEFDNMSYIDEPIKVEIKLERV